MGVHGLWRLIEPSGKPVPLETLENKVLAIDISIWLHQAVKGFQDARGAPLPNAHLLGIYHRLCKLLYFRIKPVFIFDGGVPFLKKQTIAKRNQQSSKIRNDATSVQQKILSTLLKHSAIQKVISEGNGSDGSSTSKAVSLSTTTKEDMFRLPDIPNSDMETTLESDTSDTETSESSPAKWDLHTIDAKSAEFTALPAEVRHDILTDLKEQRKQSSWGRIHELPKHSGDFSSFQMKRLLKRYSVQVSLEEAEKEMGGHTLSLNELEKLLTEEGIVTASKSSTKRIASDENRRYLLIKDVKSAVEQAKTADGELPKNEGILDVYEDSDTSSSKSSESKKQVSKTNEENQTKDSEYEKDLQAAIQLSLQELPSTSNSINYDYMENFNDADFASSSDSDDSQNIPKAVISAAQRYMLEYSDLTPHEISKIMNENSKKNKGKIKGKLTNILEAEEESEKKINPNIEVKDTHRKTDRDIEVPKDSIKTNNTTEIVSIKKSPTQTLESEDLSSSNKNCPSNINNIISQINTTNSKKLDTELKTVTECKIFPIDLKTVSQKPEIENFNLLDKDITSIKSPTTSDSDNDFIDVKSSEILNKTTEKISKTSDIELISESDDSDFEEVEETPMNKPTFSVIINRDDTKLEDDLFDDIFNVPAIESQNKSETKKTVDVTKLKEIPEQKILEESETDDELIEVVSENKIIEEKSKDSNKTVIADTDDILISKPKMTIEELNKMQIELAQEQKELTAERNAKERMASDITGQMYLEAQELLELFGMPYIIAPMEAEAQCAYLNTINLTDGTITDDSDIWLFGGETVYKNFFNQKKHVLEYKSDRIKQYFKLSREQMILLALLVGSDYTVGIQGIGPVTALEILAAFPPAKNVEISILSQNELLAGLTEFKHWLVDGRSYGPGRTTLRSKLQNINILDGFPNLEVVRAYLQPAIESSKETFSWGQPDITGLVDFAREKFGWTRLKTEEILKPVIKKMKETGKQKSIKDYFGVKHKREVTIEDTNVSKRVKSAISKMGKTREELQKEEQEQKKNKGRKKRENLMVLTKDLLTEDKEILEKNVEDKEGGNKSKKGKEKQNKLKERKRKISSKVLNKNVTEENLNNTNDSTDKQKNIEDKIVTEADLLQEEDSDFIEINISKRLKTAISKLNKPSKEINNESEEPKKRGRKRRNLMELTPDLLKEDSDLSQVEPEIKISKEADINLSATTSNSAQTQETNKKICLQKLKAPKTEMKKPDTKTVQQKQEVKKTRKTNAVREVIPQRERDKINALKTKLKAIEVYRKCKIDKTPMKKKKKIRQPKEDAGLSESSDSS